MPVLSALGAPLRMSKYLSKSATKRLPLTSKHARKGFYKGKGCASTGSLTSKARFIRDERKRVELNVPDLTGFKLKPYVAHTTHKYPGETGIVWPPVQQQEPEQKQKSWFKLF